LDERRSGKNFFPAPPECRDETATLYRQMGELAQASPPPRGLRPLSPYRIGLGQAEKIALTHCI